MRGANFHEQLQNTGISRNSRREVEELLAGKLIKIIGNSNGHNYGEEGTTFTASREIFNPATGYGITTGHNDVVRLNGPTGNHINFRDFVIVVNYDVNYFNEAIEGIREKQEKLSEELASLESKKAFLEESGLQLFEPEAYMAHRIMEISTDSSLTKEQRVNALTEYLKI